MTYNKLGTTGLTVSALSYGASALGGVYYQIDEDEGVKAVHAALDSGINYIDVSPAYGATKAETVLGRALHGIDRSRYLLSTKVGKKTQPGSYGSDSFDYSSAAIRDSLEASRQRIGVEYFDIVYLHDFDYEGHKYAEQALTEGYETLSKLKREGIIGAVGAGIYDMDLWKRTLLETDVDVLLVHNHNCLNDIRLCELTPLCRQKGVGIVNASPFGSGLLTDRGAPAWHPVSQEQRALFRKAAELCRLRGSSLSQLALQFSAQSSNVSTTLFSSARADSVQRNLQWYAEACNYELVAEVQCILEPVMNFQWEY